MAKSDFETRCRAVERLLVEAAPELARGALAGAEEILRVKLLDGPWSDEVEARQLAAGWLRAAQRRGAGLQEDPVGDGAGAGHRGTMSLDRPARCGPRRRG